MYSYGFRSQYVSCKQNAYYTYRRNAAGAVSSVWRKEHSVRAGNGYTAGQGADRSLMERTRGPFKKQTAWDMRYS
jgi:hypothetical protein